MGGMYATVQPGMILAREGHTPAFSKRTLGTPAQPVLTLLPSLLQLGGWLHSALYWQGSLWTMQFRYSFFNIGPTGARTKMCS